MSCEATARVESETRARTRTDFIVEWRDSIGENDAVSRLIPFFVRPSWVYMPFVRGVSHDARPLSASDLFLAHPFCHSAIYWQRGLSFGSSDVAAPP